MLKSSAISAAVCTRSRYHKSMRGQVLFAVPKVIDGSQVRSIVERYFPRHHAGRSLHDFSHHEPIEE